MKSFKKFGIYEINFYDCSRKSHDENLSEQLAHLKYGIKDHWTFVKA